MVHEFSEQQTLVDLGLTLIQAKVYLALVENGPAKISAIANNSKVARPDTYRTLSKLKQLGLVEKIIQTPLKYRAISIEKGLSFLLKTKTKKYEEVRARTQLLLDIVRIKNPKSKKPIENTQFVLIPKGRTVIERIRNAIEKARHSMDLVLSWKRFSRGISSTFAESIEIAWAKNVKTRFIIEHPLENKTVKQLIQFCNEKPFSQVRLTRSCPKTILGIFDKKEIFIIVSSKADLPDSPALWSNNPSLLAMAEDHFEVLWLQAMESPHFEKRSEPA